MLLLFVQYGGPQQALQGEERCTELQPAGDKDKTKNLQITAILKVYAAIMGYGRASRYYTICYESKQGLFVAHEIIV